MKQAEMETSSDSFEENLPTKSEKVQNPIQPKLTQNHHLTCFITNIYIGHLCNHETLNLFNVLHIAFAIAE
jgi:hypothetical protein